MQTKTIAMLLLVAIATIGTTGAAIQLAQGQFCREGQPGCSSDDTGHGQSFQHDINGDIKSHGHA